MALTVRSDLVLRAISEADVWLGKDGKAKGKVKVGWVGKLECQSGEKMVVFELDTRESGGNGKGAEEAVDEVVTAEVVIAEGERVAREVLGERADEKTIPELMAGKGSAKDVKAYKEKVKVGVLEPEDIPV